MSPEEKTDHEQGETLSGISALLKNNNSLYSAKSTIFNLFMEGFSILFKATYQTPHTMETFSLTAALKKRELATIQAF